MMSTNQRLNVVKLNELKRNFGFPDDYLIRILPKYPDMFRLINHSGRRSSMEIELVSWYPEFAISAIEASAQKQGCEPCFACTLPSTWVKSWERFCEFNSTPYISPYVDPRGLLEGSKEMEKRTIGLVHELLSLTLWKKLSIVKLGHFRREFSLPEKLNVLLLKHPGIFYVSNKYQIYTVLLREGYNGAELIDRDPLVMVKDKFGELMQEGLHEYNHRHRLLNLEKMKKKGMISVRSEKRKDNSIEVSEQDDTGDVGWLAGTLATFGASLIRLLFCFEVVLVSDNGLCGFWFGLRDDAILHTAAPPWLAYLRFYLFRASATAYTLVSFSAKLAIICEGKFGGTWLVSISVPFGKSQPPPMHMVKPSLAPALSPVYQASAFGPSNAPLPRHHRLHRHHHHRVKPVVVASSPSEDQSCGQVCSEPLTAAPFGSPCACVFPMKVRLLLGMAPYAIFPVMNQLEIEVAAGTYLKQSQVKIMGASADSQNQGKTVVDINLVPLGDKFDNTTAILTYDRFWHKKVPLNNTLFGDYEVISISYPGIPSSPPYSDYMGSGPSGTAGDLPITAHFVSKSQKMNARTIAIVALSAFVVLLVFIGAVFIFLRWRKFGRPSSAVGPTIASSINKRSGIGSLMSTSIASSTSMSLVSTMATCMLSVKTFPYAELEQATEKFSSKRILGEGGFGRVYHGIMEDGTEVAVKLLTRDNQNGDREFIAEVEMLSRLHHRNLVKLIGICIEGRTRCLVYELVPNGSVESHLHGMFHRNFEIYGVILWYVAPEYAMTGHLLVKSDVYSYGVVLLELLSGRKPVDMFQPPGEENLVTWARPLLTSREGLEQLVDPSLAGTYGFDDMAKVAAIASMCVHPEVTNRPFMGEVVQALKLIYNDMDETCGDNCSQKESSAPDSDFKVDLAPSYGSWWNAGGISPRITHGQASSFITMEYSSGPLEETENRPFSASSLVGDRLSLAIKQGNRSGPLRTVRSKTAFYRLRGSMSEHGGLLSKRNWNGGYWSSTKVRANGIGAMKGKLYAGTAEKISPPELADTTGAGDAFIGSVLYAEKMLPFAAQGTAAGCRALGARAGLPYRSDPRLFLP
ncbi:hypothetical protein GH714_026541 [Hevea brasiliensis]|uniref:Protein kinase domain-containing protein n=1 Tax=Hevea brasiliensis TaxID=3981 RepID=A0A6A6KX98_HEVBR|nr:hypothetical protein GH714_026541 [Hevea brasiliensis]